jgi:hypothetical protein
MTTARYPTWVYQSVGSLLTGATVWAWLAWRDYPKPLLIGAAVTVISVAWYWILPDHTRTGTVEFDGKVTPKD